MCKHGATTRTGLVHADPRRRGLFSCAHDIWLVCVLPLRRTLSLALARLLYMSPRERAHVEGPVQWRRPRLDSSRSIVCVTLISCPGRFFPPLPPRRGQLGGACEIAFRARRPALSWRRRRRSFEIEGAARVGGLSKRGCKECAWDGGACGNLIPFDSARALVRRYKTIETGHANNPNRASVALHLCALPQARNARSPLTSAQRLLSFRAASLSPDCDLDKIARESRAKSIWRQINPPGGMPQCLCILPAVCVCSLPPPLAIV